jgi:hypothetical protein
MDDRSDSDIPVSAARQLIASTRRMEAVFSQYLLAVVLGSN